MVPNLSLKRRANGWPRCSSMTIMLSRGQPLAPA